MALSRKMLKGMGLTDEQIDTIIEAHTETVDSLKSQADAFKADSEELTQVKKDLEKAQADLETERKASWKVKYDAIKEDFDNYKKEQETEKAHNQKVELFKALLKEANVSDKRVDTVLKCTKDDIDTYELGDDGKFKDSAKLLEGIKTEWADFIEREDTKGATAPNPEVNGEKTGKDAYDAMSLADKMKYANEHPQEVAGWNKKGA